MYTYLEVFLLSEMQAYSSRMWSRVTVSIPLTISVTFSFLMKTRYHLLIPSLSLSFFISNFPLKKGQNTTKEKKEELQSVYKWRSHFNMNKCQKQLSAMIATLKFVSWHVTSLVKGIFVMFTWKKVSCLFVCTYTVYNGINVWVE